jgi:hypothetical protein
MRLVGRFALVFTAATVPTLVALSACQLPEHLAGLQNETPNQLGTPGAVASTGGSTTTSGSTASSSGSAGGSDAGSTPEGGPASTVCDSAEAITDAVPACVTCSTANCVGAYTTCMNTPGGACALAVACLAPCTTASCIAGCLNMYPAYEAYAQCLFTLCTSTCGLANSLGSCVLTDAGTD